MSLVPTPAMVHRRLLACCACLALLVIISCAERREIYLESEHDPSGFALEDAGSTQDAAVSMPVSVPMCPLTTCSFPWVTCPSSTYPCGTNLLTDDENCGGCGIRCPGENWSTTSKWTCVDGKCQFSCTHAAQDNCDGDYTNGCETFITDKENCGQCGNKCPDGPNWLCYLAQCTNLCVLNNLPDTCKDICTDLRVDDGNCGTCGTKCDPTGQGLPALPSDMYYGCDQGLCGAAKCKNPERRNCNGDTEDGCEVQLHTNENCRFCGEACGPGKVCTFTGSPGWKCVCDDGETLCGGDACRSLSDDPTSCGACFYNCPGLYAAHFNATCTDGACGGECEAGYADCDGLLNNGCEVNTRADNRNCGACGNACLPGQVCAFGKCAVIPCDAGTPEQTK